MKRPLTFRLYAAAARALQPFAPALLARRARRGKEDPYRLDERLGRPTLPRPPGPLAWLHGVSVGESLAHLPLVARLARERPDVALLVTSGTRTSAELLEQRLPPQAMHQYVPLDTPAAAQAFVDHWRPDLGVFVESELWPNLLFAAKAAGARLALMSARISSSSRRGWDRSPAAARALLDLFDLITAQDTATAQWIAARSGREPARLDLKRLAEPLPFNEAELARLRGAVGDRRVLLAASTHPGEEELIAEVAQQLPSKPLLIFAPRHPERGAEVASLLSAMGMAPTRRFLGQLPTPDATAYVADTLGELGLLYRLADAVVLGGSLAPGLSGHNPLEPARLGKAVVAGQHVASFAEVYAELKAQQAVLIAHGPAEFASAVAAMIAEPALAAAMGRRAQALCTGEEPAFDAAWSRLQALLPAP